MNLGKSTTVFLLSILVILQSSLPAEAQTAAPCTTSVQCHDGNPDTIDLCHPRRHRCINYVPISRVETTSSKLNSARQDIVQTSPIRTLKSIIEETNKNPLSIKQKQQIISTAANVISEINPFLSLYRNVYKYDIVKSLRRYLRKVATPKFRDQTNFRFHLDMYNIFQQANDAHTNYVPPQPLSSTVAVVPFFVKQFFSRGSTKRRYAVSEVLAVADFGSSGFGVGSEIISYDGSPVDKVVLELGRAGYGANIDAQIADGVLALTDRDLDLSTIPSRRNLSITFKTRGGKMESLSIPWTFVTLPQEEDLQSAARSFLTRPPSRYQPDKTGVEDLLFTDAGNETDRILDTSRVTQNKRKTIRVKPFFIDLFSAEVLKTKKGDIGRLVIPTFEVGAEQSVFAELTRILKQMPRNGLIVDIRGNRGGFFDYAKGIAELLSDKPVDARPVSIQASDLILRLFSQDPKLTSPAIREQFVTFSTPYRRALETASKSGEPFVNSGPSIFSSPLDARTVPQAYQGPVVTVSDGQTYSAADMYTSIQKDSGASKVVFTSGNVGAGGASVLSYELATLLSQREFESLPGGVSFRTAFQKWYRLGENVGAIEEHFGIEPDLRYFPTFGDVVNDDCDLFEFLAEELSKSK